MALFFGSLVVELFKDITKLKMFFHSPCPHFINCLNNYAYATPTFIIEALHLVTHVEPLRHPLSESNGFYGTSIAL